ncbi:MAG: HAD hydrolase-like protein [Defluviitaleaceae bacterium]|nr:HAD hydrolase-like protein [Defluviitaleaceae bacterium]
MRDTRCVFFDLDGTLTDSEPGLAQAYRYIFDKYGIDIGGRDLRLFFGPPITQCLAPYFATEAELMAVIEDFRAYYRPLYISDNSLYPGIVEMLYTLKARGYTLAVVTGKPEQSAADVVAHFGIRPYFDGVYGAAGLHTEKIETLNHALKLHNCRPEHAVMVGDRLYDLEAAMLAKTGGIGVLWGYGTREELCAYDNIMLAASPEDVTNYFS